MRLLVGLGNPGPQYETTRHNAGFLALDAIADKYNITGWQQKFNGLAATGMIAGEKVILLKPQTFMNLSGKSVAPAMQFYKLPLDAVTVYHDELDIPLGEVRRKQGGGHAGHNGLKSIDAMVGKDYHRVRIGIGRPEHKGEVSSYVLSRFEDEEWKFFTNILGNIDLF